MYVLTHPITTSTLLAIKTNTVSLLLRIEAACVLAASLGLFCKFHGSWGWFAILFLLPDLSMVGYLANPRLGSICYNLVHTYFAPAVGVGLIWWMTGQIPSPLWLIWPAHIAFDRMLGYGLKFPDAFRHTHLSIG